MEKDEIFHMMKDLDISLYTSIKNYEELIQSINYYGKNRTLWDKGNEDNLIFFMKEFFRLLHNYLASIYTLIKHTERFKNKLKNDSFSKKYETEFEKYKINNYVVFLEDLRHFTQKKNILPIKTTSVIGTSMGVLSQRLLLKKKDLLNWEGLRKKSKKLLDELPEDIELKDIINRYQEFISNFYNWIYKELKNLIS